MRCASRAAGPGTERAADYNAQTTQPMRHDAHERLRAAASRMYFCAGGAGRARVGGWCVWVCLCLCYLPRRSKSSRRSHLDLRSRSHYLLVPCFAHPSCLFIARLLGGAHTGEHVFWIGSAAHKDVDSEANRHPRRRGASGRANLPSLTALGTLPISIIRNSPAATDAGGQQRQRRRRRKRGRPRR